MRRPARTPAAGSPCRRRLVGVTHVAAGGQQAAGSSTAASRARAETASGAAGEGVGINLWGLPGKRTRSGGATSPETSGRACQPRRRAYPAASSAPAGARGAAGAGPRGYLRAVSGYLDAAAGLPLHPAARAALLAALDDGWADPTKLYAEGRRARRLLDGGARGGGGGGRRPAGRGVLRPLGHPGRPAGRAGAARRAPRVGDHVVHSAVEHSCVLAGRGARRRSGHRGAGRPARAGSTRTGTPPRCALTPPWPR
jgi:hypothetical protein